MSINQNEIHETQVALWEEKNTLNLNARELIQIYGIAIQVVEKRCLVTLSKITVHVVLDRVLHESHEIYPLFAKTIIEPEGFNISGLIQNCEQYQNDELRKALRYFLVKFLAVIGNITAGVLTNPLHRELMSVTLEEMQKLPDVQNIRETDSSKKNQGKS